MMLRKYPNRLIRKIQRDSKRLLKQFRQLRLFPNATAAPFFVLGVQRSGTNMLMSMLDMSINVFSYNEDANAAFNNYRIRDKSVRQRLLSRAHCRWLVFKPICDIQYSIDLLDSHSGSKAIWIFRDFRDVANSAIDHWGREQYLHIERLVTQSDDYWFTENVDPSTRSLLERFYRSELSDHEAAVLKWYVRNQWFFKLELFKRRSQVLVIQYEELVSDPVRVGRQVYDFLGLEFDSSYVQHLRKTSIRKNEFPEIRPEIEDLCQQLMNQLVLESSPNLDSQSTRLL